MTKYKSILLATLAFFCCALSVPCVYGFYVAEEQKPEVCAREVQQARQEIEKKFIAQQAEEKKQRTERVAANEARRASVQAIETRMKNGGAAANPAQKISQTTSGPLLREPLAYELVFKILWGMLSACVIGVLVILLRKKNT